MPALDPHSRRTDHSAAAHFKQWALMQSLTSFMLSRPKTFLHGQAAAVGIAIFNGVGKLSMRAIA